MAEAGWVTLTKLGWERVVNFLPNWILKKAYPISKMRERVQMFATGYGPQFYVTPGRPLSVETNYVVVVNLAPFPLDLENMQLEILLEGTQLASKDVNISSPIQGMSILQTNLRFELSDNQARIVREYPSNCPILRMGGRANIRAPFGLVSLPVHLEARAIVHK